MNNSILHIILILLFVCILYILIIRPLKLYLNSEIIYPIVSTIIYNQKIFLSDSHLTLVSVNDTKRIFHFPFGGWYYIIPVILMMISKNWFGIKILTKFHIGIVSIQFFVFLILIKSSWIYSIENSLHNLSMLLGASFIFISIKDLFLKST